MRKIIICAVFAALGMPVLAAPEDCIPIQAYMERLDCYDREVGRDEALGGKEGDPEEAVTNWQYSTLQSEMTDFTNIYLQNTAQNPIACSQFKAPERPYLLLRCAENTTALFFGGESCHLTSGHGGYGAVQIRVDDNKAMTYQFDDSTNSRSLGLWNGRRSIPVIKSMIGGERLRIRFTPFSMNAAIAEFDISGLDEAIKPLREACGW